MKYSRILFTIKNDNFLLNILPVLYHPVKNKENVKEILSFQDIDENMDVHTSPPGI
jgi:hypothetical protein